MSTRVVCLRAPSVGRSDLERTRGVRDRACPVERGWRHLIDRRGILLSVLSNPSDAPPIVLEGEIGVVIGHLFNGDGRRCCEKDFPRPQAYAAAEAGGEAWVKGYWGAYAAFLHDHRHDVMRIIRDPMGSRPVYYADCNGIGAAFTHVGDYLATGAPLEIDRRSLDLFLAHARHVSAATGIVRVRELLAGCELQFWREGERDVVTVWAPDQPRTFVGRAFDEAALAVHDVVCRAGAAWSEVPRILHRLSGGLDSSAALYALARERSGGEIIAINQRSPYAESDERVYAREVARAFRIELIEYEARPENANYERLLGIEPEAKPTLSSLSFADPAFAEAAGEFAGAVVGSGQGGDQIFHRSSEPLIVADAIRDGLSSRQIFKIAADNAAHGRRSIWSGAHVALGQGILRQRVDRYAAHAPETPWASIDGSRVRPMLQESAALHPWAAQMRETPARAARVRRVIDLQYYHQASSLTLCFQPALVLASQPVVETCLGIAPYIMVEGGVDRALERAAFGAHLPASVLKRRGKGDSTRYVAKALERNLAFMRDVIIDGELVRCGAIERREVARAFDQAGTFSQAAKVGMMNTIVAELWLRRLRTAEAAAASAVSVRPPHARCSN